MTVTDEILLACTVLAACYVLAVVVSRAEPIPPTFEEEPDDDE